MARKNIASMKPAKHVKAPELPPIEEVFDNAKQAFVNTAEVAVVISKRIDNLLNIRKAAYEFWGNMLDEKMLDSERIAYFKEKQAMTTAVYETILAVVKDFELDEFLKDDMRDYFEDVMPKADAVEKEEDLFNAFLVSGIVRPWGEKMTGLHHTMLDERDQRKAVEEEG